MNNEAPLDQALILLDDCLNRNIKPQTSQERGSHECVLALLRHLCFLQQFRLSGSGSSSFTWVPRIWGEIIFGKMASVNS